MGLLGRMAWGALCCALLLEPVLPARAADPDDAPQLRINTVQHLDTIHAVTVSPDGAFIATAGDDKTVRIWDGETGAPLSTLRIPVGEGPEGVIYSLLYTPTMRVLLAGGISGLEWDGKNYLYLLRPGQNAIQGRIPLEGVLRRVAWGSDGAGGQRLLLALSAAQGGAIQVRDTKGKVVDEDTTLTAAPAWVEGTPDGGIVAVTADGVLLRYGPGEIGQGMRPKVFALPGGGDPAVVRVSPDGTLVAVGYHDRRQVDVLRLKDFKSVAKLGGDTGAGGTPHFNVVAWLPVAGKAPGGGELWAGGSYGNSEGRTILRRWKTVAKEKSWTDLAVAEDALTALEASPKGEMVFASSDPSWGVVTKAMKLDTKRYLGRPGADFRAVYDGLLARAPVGDDLEGAIAFRFDGANEVGALLFDAEAGDLLPLAPKSAALKTIRESWAKPVPPAELTDWRNSDRPAFRGTVLPLAPQERSLSADAMPGGGFVLGADRTLYVHGPDGGLRTSLVLASPAFGVLSLDRDRILAAHGDGTLRWYRIGAAGLREEAALFIDRRSRAWLAWLPDGRFTHSDNGGQELAGYHLNRKADQTAEWVGFAQVYRAAYQPEAVRDVLLGRADLAATGLGDKPEEEQIAGDGSPGDATTGGDTLADAGPPERRREEADPGPEEQPGPGITGLPGEVVPQGTPGPQAPAGPKPQAPVSIAAREAPKVAVTEICPIGAAGLGACLPATLATRGLGRIEAAKEQAAEFVDGVRQLGPDVTRLLLKLEIGGLAGDLSKLDVFVNGQTTGAELTRGLGRLTAPAATPQAATEAALKLDREVPLRDGLNRIEVRAYDARGVYGRSGEVWVFRPATEQAKQPDLHLLVVGANSYSGEVRALSFARPDAAMVAEVIGANKPDHYGAIHVTQLFDAEVTRAGILAALSAIAEKAGTEDSVVVYLAGHGLEAEGGSYTYVTPEVTALSALAERGLGQDDLTGALGRIRAGNVLVLLDTCHSGAFPAAAAGTMNNETGYMVISASTTVEQALDGYNGEHGVFAYALREALTRGAVDFTGVAEALVVGNYLRKQVPILAAEKGISQRPQIKNAASETVFPLAQVAKAP